MENLKLTIPTTNNLYFKKQLKEDPLTMDYNAGYDVNFDGYNYNDGTIKTSLDDLKNNWFKRFINNWPQTYYAYIENNGILIGEIYAKYDNSYDGYEIGIVIKGEYRGNGYSTQAIKLLITELKKLGAKKLFHDLPETRKAAIKADTNNGFKLVKKYIGMKKFGKPETHVILELNIQ